MTRPDAAGPTTELSLERELVGALPRLRAHLARGGGDVDDLAQEAAARALGARGGFDPRRGGLWPWLRRIADRVRIDHHRRVGAAPRATADLDPADPRAEGASEGATEGPLAAREAALRLVATLPARERAALLAFHVEGRSIEAIAAALGVPAGTVKSDLSRARRRLAHWHTDPEDRR